MKQWYTVTTHALLPVQCSIPEDGPLVCFLLITIILSWTCCLSINPYILRKCFAALFPTLLPIFLQTQKRIPQTNTQGMVCLKGIKAKMLFAIGSCWERKISFLQCSDTGCIHRDGPTLKRCHPTSLILECFFLKKEQEVGWVERNYRIEINIIKFIEHDILKE